MIYIRADGNSIIGSGHVMRSLAIANAFKKYRKRCTFITADTEMSSIIKANGMNQIVLKTDWRNVKEEKPLLKELFSKTRAELVVVDSYQVDRDWFKTLKNIGFPVAYIDDLNAFYYDVDYIINYNIFAQSFNYNKIYKAEQLLLGCEYTPLREEFQGLQPIKIKETVKNIFLTVGGSDPYNITLKIIKDLLCQKDLKNMVYHVIIGSLNPNNIMIKDFAQGYNNIILYEDVTHMAGLMQKCDIAISAGGGTLYELCACGVPTISLAYADNQLANVQAFHDETIIPYMGDTRKDEFQVFQNIRNTLLELTEAQLERCKQQEKMLQVVDGNGAQRIVNQLLKNINSEHNF